jgi:hypothetical protein
MNDDELRREGDRIAALLDDLRPLTTAPVWQRVEEVVQRLLHLYGAGLGRVLALVEVDEAGKARLDADPLVSSLLALHGLHPLSPAVRARRAADEVCRQLAAPAVTLTVSAEGVARVQVAPGFPAGPALERAILEAAPELSAVVIDVPERPSGLVQIDLRRQGAA